MAINKLNKGFTKQSNRLKAALARLKLTDAERRVIEAVSRFTEGFHRDMTSVSTGLIAKYTELPKSSVRRAIRALRGNILRIKRDEGNHLPFWVGFNPVKWWDLQTAYEEDIKGTEYDDPFYSLARMYQEGTADAEGRKAKPLISSDFNPSGGEGGGLTRPRSRTHQSAFKDINKDREVSAQKQEGGEAASQKAEHPTPSDQASFIMLDCPHCQRESAWEDYEPAGIKDDQPVFKCPECLYKVHIIPNPTTLQPEIFEADQDPHRLKKTRSPSPARSLESSPSRSRSDVSHSMLQCPWCEKEQAFDRWQDALKGSGRGCPECGENIFLIWGEDGSPELSILPF
jgi:phage replication O-like protein O